MNGDMENEIKQIIIDQMEALNRPDFYRSPLIAFSSAHDERYSKLKEIIGQWHLNPVELLPDAKSVVSYFVPFTKSVVLEPAREKDVSIIWAEAYLIINSYFDHINKSLSDYLVKLGFSVKSIPATNTYIPEEMKSMWSHRSAAVIAGLGSFGANKMLITEKGSGGRFCSIITSAPLKPTQHSTSNGCLNMLDGSCGLCIDVCPVDALKPDSIDKFACQDEIFKNEEILEEKTAYKGAGVCGKCISVCPLAYVE